MKQKNNNFLIYVSTNFHVFFSTGENLINLENKSLNQIFPSNSYCQVYGNYIKNITDDNRNLIINSNGNITINQNQYNNYLVTYNQTSYETFKVTSYTETSLTFENKDGVTISYFTTPTSSEYYTLNVKDNYTNTNSTIGNGTSESINVETLKHDLTSRYYGFILKLD